MMLLLRRSWVQLTADRRKFGALCAMLGIGLLLWARLIVMSNMPRTAVADPAKAVAVAKPPVMSDKPFNPPMSIALDRQPTRDPFVICEQYFPNPTSVGYLPAEAEKSLAQQTEDPEQAEARFRARLRALVDRMKLDAAMSSAALAVINGNTYRTGDQVPVDHNEQTVFTLTEVKPRSVILEFEGRRFELEMSTAGG